MFFREAELLRRNGHETVFFSMRHPENRPSKSDPYFVSHIELHNPGWKDRVRAPGRILYSIEARSKMKALLEAERPDLAHLHSIYHHLSPSVLHALKAKKIPMVMTLHDYKTVCASYLLRAGGEPCEACAGGRHWNCFFKKCVHGSRLKSALNTVEMILHHEILKIYDLIDCFIVPSRFMIAKLRAMGFTGKTVHLPNFIDASRYVPVYAPPGREIAYFGRLSREKGIETLVDAVRDTDLDLHLIGEGPLKSALVEKVANEKINNVRFSGYLREDELKKKLGLVQFVAVPSTWYENNPLSILEAFAMGKPVVGADIGGIPELVRNNETGMLFEPGNVESLREALIKLSSDRDRLIQMGKNAREMVEKYYSPDVHFRGLMEIYRSASTGLEQ